MPPHILVVDDYADVRDLIAAALVGEGYRVSAAEDAAEMRAFLEKGNDVDAVIMDCLLPGVAMHDLLLFAMTLKLPVIMISGSPNAIQFAAEHRLPLLEKPFRRSEILNAVATALAGGELPT